MHLLLTLPIIVWENATRSDRLCAHDFGIRLEVLTPLSTDFRKWPHAKSTLIATEPAMPRLEWLQ